MGAVETSMADLTSQMLMWNTWERSWNWFFWELWRIYKLITGRRNRNNNTDLDP